MLRTKTFVFLLLALAIALVGCGQLTPPEIATQPAQADDAPAAAEATESTSQGQAGAAAPTLGVPANPVGPVIAACRPDTSTQVDPSVAEQFPKVGPDWAKGPDNAYLTIIEYSDFQ